MHRSCLRSLLLPSILPWLPLPAIRAQNDVVVPAAARTSEGYQLHGLPFGVPGFRTQLLVEAAAIAPNGALLQAIRFRGDRGFLIGFTIPNVTVTLSHTSASTATVSPSFAANATGPGTVVFQGTVALPSYLTGGLQPRGFDIVLPLAAPFLFDASQGNLLIDVRADNPNLAPPTYWLDAAEPGGSTVAFGEGGQLATFDTLALTVGGLALGVVEAVPPLALTIGRNIDFRTELFATTPPGLLGLASSVLPQPLDLTPAGAPGNRLYIDPEVLLPLVWTPTLFGTQEARITVSVPNDPALVGVLVYGQSAVLDAANPLGLVTGNAVELRIGDPAAPALVRQVDSFDPDAVAGVLLDFAEPGAAPRPGAVVFRLDGTFF